MWYFSNIMLTDNTIINKGRIFMKRKILSLFLCSVMLAGGICGCESKSDLSQSGSSTITDIPAEAMERLNKAHDIKPVIAPKEEWDTEKICNSFYINGKQIDYPFTINDLGNEFEMIDTEEYKFKYNEEKKKISCYLTYYGDIVAYVGIDNCDNPTAVLDWPIDTIIFTNEASKRKVFPVSFNGVSIGDSEERMFGNLPFMKVYEAGLSSDDVDYYLSYENDDIIVRCHSTGGKVELTSINFNMEDNL